MDQDTKKRVVEGALHVFHERGIRFTMDDLAANLGMSKKTIYKLFSDKESLLYAMVEHTFDSIKESEAQVLEEQGVEPVERLRRLLGVMPETYREFDFTQVYLYKDKYPNAYKRIEQRLESGWEKTHALLEELVSTGYVREINFEIFQMTFEAAVERFLTGDELKRNNIRYVDALEQLVDVLVDGIRVHESE